MAASALNEGWFKLKAINDDWNTLSWTTSISRTRVSTVDGLRFTGNVDTTTIHSLESLLSTVQRIKLNRLPLDGLERVQFIAAGETFSVYEYRWRGEVVALKQIRLAQDSPTLDPRVFQRRLQAVLGEILIMCHPPLTHHPNIAKILGYGWGSEEQTLSPFIAVELAAAGSLRKYLKEHPKDFRAKQILIGDIAAGLTALHRCGIVHGDLKLDNILVFTSLDRPCMSIAKVSDFGHSIVLDSTLKKTAFYVGTRLYNAPEVANQRAQLIPTEQLHKCDIWAFGLCVWEVLANGHIYFQSDWLEDSSHSIDSLCTASAVGAPDSLQGSGQLPPDIGRQYPFERFDFSHLKSLAIHFVNLMSLPGIGIERSFLRAVFEHTLQKDPGQRISDLNRLPLMDIWRKAPGGHQLQANLATLAMSRDLRYSMFNRDNNAYIPWVHQQQLLRDLEARALGDDSPKGPNNAAFQTMLCYINGFGTVRDYQKATTFLRKATESGHLLAETFGLQIDDGCSPSISQSGPNYTECLALAFRKLNMPDMSSSLTLCNDRGSKRFESFREFKAAVIIDLQLLHCKDGDVEVHEVAWGESNSRCGLLETAVRYDDAEMLTALLSSPYNLATDLASNLESLLLTATQNGNLDILDMLLKHQHPSSDFRPNHLLHWLFCFPCMEVDDIRRLVRNLIGDQVCEDVLNQMSPGDIILHPQWPFQVHGTPLATAILSGSIPVVRALLELGADPLGPAFPPSENELTPPLTPLHLAVKYNFPEIFQLCWDCAFPGSSLSVQLAAGHPALGKFPLACALSLQTPAERLAVHGNDYMTWLRRTAELLSCEMMLQQSGDGRTAMTQAIDLDDIDTLEVLLEVYPDLVSTKIEIPGDGSLHTYPLHFAVKLGSNKESQESLRVVQYIMHRDPTALDRQDGSSFTPIHIAAMGTSTWLTKFLLEQGPSVDSTCGLGQLPLHLCQSSSNVEFLYQSGAPVNYQDTRGRTAAHAAASQGLETVLQTLVHSGADVTITDMDGNTPLHCAAVSGSIPVIEILLRAGASIDAANIQMETPLYLAADAGRFDLMKCISDSGANPFIRNVHGSSPFRAALTMTSPFMLSRFLENPGVNHLSEKILVENLYFAAAHGEPATLKDYLQFLHHLWSDSRNCGYKNDLKALHIAVAAYRVDLVDVLLSHEFSVNSVDSSANTPLLLACQLDRGGQDLHSTQRTEICQCLLNNGADPFAANRGITPFLIAQKNRDVILMTLFLNHVAETCPVDEHTHLDTIFKAIHKGSRGIVCSKKVKKLPSGMDTGNEWLGFALSNGNWDFAAALIAGHFVEESVIRKSFNLPYEDEQDGIEWTQEEIPDNKKSDKADKFVESGRARKLWKSWETRNREKPKPLDLPSAAQWRQIERRARKTANDWRNTTNDRRLILLHLYCQRKDSEMVRRLHESWQLPGQPLPTSQSLFNVDTALTSKQRSDVDGLWGHLCTLYACLLR